MGWSWRTDEELEIVAGAVAGRQSFAFGDGDQGASGADGDAFAERLLAPAQADHVVEFGPVQECVIGGMEDHEAATATHVGFQRALRHRAASGCRLPYGRR